MYASTDAWGRSGDVQAQGEATSSPVAGRVSRRPRRTVTMARRAGHYGAPTRWSRRGHRRVRGCGCSQRPETALAYTLPVWSAMVELQGPAASRETGRLTLGGVEEWMAMPCRFVAMKLRKPCSAMSNRVGDETPAPSSAPTTSSSVAASAFSPLPLSSPSPPSLLVWMHYGRPPDGGGRQDER